MTRVAMSKGISGWLVAVIAVLELAMCGCQESPSEITTSQPGGSSQSMPVELNPPQLPKPRVVSGNAEVDFAKPPNRKSFEKHEDTAISSERETGRSTTNSTTPNNSVSNDSPPLAGRRSQPVSVSVDPVDPLPQYDEKQLASVGIRSFASERLKLYSDIDPNIAKQLSKYVDGAYKAWLEYFDPCESPSEGGDDYQIAGHLMASKRRFRRYGLLPRDLPRFHHGRHRGNSFWMNEQEYDYYRRHLLIHEATHCYMMTLRGIRAPSWYLEGMAELFGTHAIDEQGTIHFGVMPDRKENFVGLGRIGMIRDAVKVGRLLPFDAVRSLQPEIYIENEAYAWSWALCKFLDTHPRYQGRFRELASNNNIDEFRADFDNRYADDRRDLSTEWLLFVAHLQYGYDIVSARIDFRAGQPLDAGGQAARAEIAANRGWQSSGVHVEQGVDYIVTASGRFTLAQQPKPWLSEPQGISILYAEARPLGMLVGTIRDTNPPRKPRDESMLQDFPIGRQRRFTATSTGTLYLRVNDFWNDMANNQGAVRVELRRVE